MPLLKNKTTELNAKFWSNFAKNYWEKKPFTARKIKSSLSKIGEAEIFELLILYSDKCRKNKDATGFKFYVNGEQVHASDVLQVLPIQKDLNFLGYHARMNKLFSDYCLVCDELLQVSAGYKDHLLDFTNALYKHVGFPNQFAEIGLYLGNYKKTPFGVHIDSCGVFSFPIVGQKKFRLWTSDFVKKNPKLDRAFNYEKYKKNSELLIASEGDMTYWPSKAYHIAESNGQFSAAWSLGVWIDKSFQKMFSESFDHLLSQKSDDVNNNPMTSFVNLHDQTGQMSKLPKLYLKNIQMLRQLSDADLQDHYLKCWMKQVSLHGFKKNDTQFDQKKLTLKSKIQLSTKNTKILWKKSVAKKNKIFICIESEILKIDLKSGIYKLILDLNKKRKCTLSQYLTKNEMKTLNSSKLRLYLND